MTLSDTPVPQRPMILTPCPYDPIRYAGAPAPTSEAERVEFKNLLDQSNTVPGYDAAFQKWSIAQEELYVLHHVYYCMLCTACTVRLAPRLLC